jgi:hypothetical protein
MPATQTTDGSLASHANDLYWNSGQTVEGIMTDLGMSKNALYSSLAPLPAGRSCGTCGGQLVFTNRTSRDSGRATCATCAQEVEVQADGTPRAHASQDHVVEAAMERDFADGGASGLSRPQPEGRWSRLRDDLASVEPERVALVGGAAALGVMVGAAAARAVRQMR